MIKDYDRTGLIALIKSEFKLNWQGIHGANHWARVLHHGKNIGQLRGADLLVVELFSFLHDSCRWDDGRDPLMERGQLNLPMIFMATILTCSLCN